MYLLMMFILTLTFLLWLQESDADDISEVTSKLSTVQLEKVSASPPALRLPKLFSLTPSSSGKGGNLQKRNNLTTETQQAENAPDRKSSQILSDNHVDNPSQGLYNIPCLS